ncbi:hypothetical protein K505DRAFT_229155, partial [Melanomma pulvis-pyrius CBS 109.77]
LAIEILYLITTTLTKISILTFYQRITSSLISKPFKICVWASILFVAAYGITFVFVLLFTCWPVEAYWYRFTTSWLKTHTYKCHDELVTLLVIISISTAQDFVACILPMFIIHKLTLPFRQKFALIVIFGIGALTCGVGALRIHWAHRVFYYVRNGDPTYDISWEALGSWVSTAVEANLTVICASAPALKAYCRCLNSSRQDERSFGWYTKHPSSRGSSKSWFSKSSQTAKSWVCCFWGERDEVSEAGRGANWGRRDEDGRLEYRMASGRTQPRTLDPGDDDDAAAAENSAYRKEAAMEAEQQRGSSVAPILNSAGENQSS